MNKRSIITHRSELIREFRRLLPDDPDLRWQPLESVSDKTASSDLLLSFDEHEVVFRPVYELTPQRTAITGSPLEIGRDDATKGTRNNPADLIVAVRLTRRMIEWCKQQRVSAIDLNGRVWLRASGLMLGRDSLPGRDFCIHIEPRDVFTGKSERIVRTLLSDITLTWRQKELVQRTGASSGLVSRVVKHLLHEGYLHEVGKKEYRVEDWQALLDAWVQQDRLKDRVSIYRYSAFGGDPVQWARKLGEACGGHSIRIAFTQWIGGWMRKPHTEPVITSAYLDRPPDADLLSKLEFREVPDAGKIWLYVPKDDGVFREVRQIQGLPVVTDAQIYADLKNTGLRGPDQATALRSLPDFCHQPP